MLNRNFTAPPPALQLLERLGGYQTGIDQGDGGHLLAFQHPQSQSNPLVTLFGCLLVNCCCHAPALDFGYGFGQRVVAYNHNFGFAGFLQVLDRANRHHVIGGKEQTDVRVFGEQRLADGIGRLKKIIRSRHFSGLWHAGVLLILVTVVGTLGYHYIGSPTATWIDSFYMTFITIATIGYGETVDLSNQPMGRLFTVAIATVGIANLSYIFSKLVALLINADLNADLRKKRMEKKIEGLSNHYIVCGIGRVGRRTPGQRAHQNAPHLCGCVEKDRPALDAWLEHHPPRAVRA